MMSSITSWGPSAWNYLHVTSYAYPEVPTEYNKEHMFNFMWYFARVIPCQRCRADFVKYLHVNLPEKMNSPVFTCRDNLINFSIQAHNYVNSKLSKPEMTREQVDKLYVYTHEDIQKKYKTEMVIMFLVFFILAALIIKCRTVCKI